MSDPGVGWETQGKGRSGTLPGGEGRVGLGCRSRSDPRDLALTALLCSTA